MIHTFFNPSQFSFHENSFCRAFKLHSFSVHGLLKYSSSMTWGNYVFHEKQNSIFNTGKI